MFAALLQPAALSAGHVHPQVEFFWCVHACSLCAVSCKASQRGARMSVCAAVVCEGRVPGEGWAAQGAPRSRHIIISTCALQRAGCFCVSAGTYIRLSLASVLRLIPQPGSFVLHVVAFTLHMISGRHPNERALQPTCPWPWPQPWLPCLVSATSERGRAPASRLAGGLQRACGVGWSAIAFLPAGGGAGACGHALPPRAQLQPLAANK